jgi:hypothetical protein
MKKILLTVLLLGFTASTAQASYNYLGPTTEANRNFQPLMKHQFEREETLDFSKDPENYKEKREKKEKFIEYQQPKLDIPPAAATQYNLQGTRPGSNNLQFVKDENGKIRIQGIK